MRGGRQHYFRFVLNQPEHHRSWFSEWPLLAAELTRHEQRTARSLDGQRRIEASSEESFVEFLAAYLEPPE